MKKLKIALTAFFSLLVLTACDNDRHVNWSPDGKRMAVVGQSLRVADADGKLSSINISGVVSCQWFADSHHVLVLREKPEKRWSAIAPMLSAKERSQAILMAEKLHAGHGTAAELEKKFGHNENGDLVLAYIYTRYGAAGVRDVFRNWQIKDLVPKFSGINVSTLQIFDLSSDGAGATPGKILLVSRKAIKGVKLSPNGKFVAVIQNGKSCDEILVIPAISGAIKKFAPSSGNLAWSRDSQSIYFLRPGQSLPSNINAIALGSLSKIDIADGGGKLLPTFKTVVDLCQISPSAGDRICPLPDGTLLFSSKAITLPATDLAGDGKQSLFNFDPIKKTLETIQLDDSSLSDSLNSFEANPDGTKVLLVTKKNAIHVLDLKSGKSILIQGESKTQLAFTPVWRSAAELCFPLRRTEGEKQSHTNDHDFEVALCQLLDAGAGGAEVVSRSWSADQFKFLKMAAAKK